MIGTMIDRQKNYHTHKTFPDNMNTETSYPSRKDKIQYTRHQPEKKPVKNTPNKKNMHTINSSHI